MPVWTKVPVAAVMLGLAGCAGAGGGLSATQTKGLQALPLFRADGQAQFVLYVSCTSEKVNCVNVENAFARWAQRRDVMMREVEANDAAFRPGRLAAPNAAPLPYRVAIDYRPAMSGGYAAKSFDRSGDSYPATVSYSATVSVFDSATGTLLQRLSPHAQQDADHGKQANPFLLSQANGLLDSLFPASPGR